MARADAGIDGCPRLCRRHSSLQSPLRNSTCSGYPEALEAGASSGSQKNREQPAMTHRILHTARASLALLALALVSTSASAVLIDFNGLGNGTPVTNQFPEATFSGEPGNGVFARNGFLCTGNPIDCANDVYIDFTNAVSNISLTAIEPNEFGTVATFFLYSGATLLGTQDLIGLATTAGTFSNGSKSVSLAGFTGVTRLEIRGPGGSGQLDSAYGGNGIGWDDLSFTIDEINAVPEPGPAGLAGLGLLAFGIARKRRAQLAA